MADNSESLKRSRRQDSRTKRRRAAEVLDAMVEAGEPISFPGVARRAAVSVSLLYADRELAARLSASRGRQREAGAERSWRLPTRSLVSDQGLRADLANANDRVRRLSEEITVLRQQLARLLGAQSDAASGRTTSPLLQQLESQVTSLEADNAQLRTRAGELEGALRESNDTVEAARAMNRELMAEINRSKRGESTGPPPTPTRALSRRARERTTTTRSV